MPHYRERFKNRVSLRSQNEPTSHRTRILAHNDFRFEKFLAPPFDSIDQILQENLPLKGLSMPVGINGDNDVVGLSDAKLKCLSRADFLAPRQLANHYLPVLEQNAGVISQ